MCHQLIVRVHLVQRRNITHFLIRIVCTAGPSCSKITKSLVNVSLKFQMLISENGQNFLLNKCEKLLHCNWALVILGRKGILLNVRYSRCWVQICSPAFCMNICELGACACVCACVKRCLSQE